MNQAGTSEPLCSRYCLPNKAGNLICLLGRKVAVIMGKATQDLKKKIMFSS